MSKKSKKTTESETPKKSASSQKDWVPLIDGSTKNPNLPDYDPEVRCKQHPDKPTLSGHGFAGGGFGLYTYCRQCNKVLTKSEEES